jgi:tetratricopeptide (TPR) repeat protein
MAIVIAAPAVPAQTSHASHTMPPLSRELLERPLPLRTGIGTAHDAVSTKVPEAQAFYDQGLAYLHSYMWVEAARSFHHALRLDPKLAMADMGLSYAYVELSAPADAHGALSRARTQASGASEHDRRHIDVRAAQMAAEDAPADATKLATYRKALDEALAAFPSDEEFWLQRGLAESADPAERGQGSRPGAVKFFERARALAPGHFAAHHFLAHAFENSDRNTDALAQAEAYAKMAPQVPHARHMLGHELRRAGRIADAIVEFESADRLEVAYIDREKMPAAQDWHYHHNLDLLGTSYQYVGRMAKAEALLKKSFEMPSNTVEQELNKREWPVFLLARGRATEALDAAQVMRGHASPLVSAMGRIQAGEALLALKQPKAAADEANAALRMMRASPEGAGLLAPALRQLQGELLLRSGQRDMARENLRRAAGEARALPGPDGWAQATFTLESIARAARDAGDWEFAEWAARQMLEHDSNYAGAHYALALAAGHNGDQATARVESDRARTLWAQADATLPELQDLKRSTT